MTTYTKNPTCMLVWLCGVVTQNLTDVLLDCRWSDQSGSVQFNGHRPVGHDLIRAWPMLGPGACPV